MTRVNDKKGNGKKFYKIFRLWRFQEFITLIVKNKSIAYFEKGVSCQELLSCCFYQNN